MLPRCAPRLQLVATGPHLPAATVPDRPHPMRLPRGPVTVLARPHATVPAPRLRPGTVLVLPLATAPDLLLPTDVVALVVLVAAMTAPPAPVPQCTAELTRSVPVALLSLSEIFPMDSRSVMLLVSLSVLAVFARSMCHWTVTPIATKGTRVISSLILTV